MLLSTRSKISVVAKPPIIGSKWRGVPCQYWNGENGTYWEVLPQMGQDALKLQKGLLSKPIDFVDLFINSVDIDK